MSRQGKTVVLVLLAFVSGMAIAVTWGATRDPSSKRVADVDFRGGHWHAALAVDVCGQWLPPAPAFEQRANQSGVTAGIHSHGDGLIHLHPFASDEAGANATVGRFMTYGGWRLTSHSFALWDDETHRDGQPSATGGAGRVQWVVGQYGHPWPSTPGIGDPADYRPRNGDIVAIYFLPDGSPRPEPPNAQTSLARIEDLGGAAALAR